MKGIFRSLLLLGTVSQLAAGQDIDWDAVEILPTPSYSIDIKATAQTVSYTTSALLASVSAAVTGTTQKCSVVVVKKRDDDEDYCKPQPSGNGPIPTPDTAAAFLSYAGFSATASAAPVPSGYTNSFTNLQASNNAYGYLGFTNIPSYDSKTCADKCSAMDGCIAFNLCTNYSNLQFYVC
jgi:hypothetical protein